jgi:hypothetical protein
MTPTFRIANGLHERSARLHRFRDSFRRRPASQLFLGPGRSFRVASLPSGDGGTTLTWLNVVVLPATFFLAAAAACVLGFVFVACVGAAWVEAVTATRETR